VDVPIAADQAVLTPAEVYEVCRRQAADVIVLGIHETGGLLSFKKAAAIAEAAGLNICLHGVFETGITTCATNQVAATVPNLDDGNQIMHQLLAEDIVALPRLVLADGKLPVIRGPGLGFDLDGDAVARASERYSKRRR
jgi:muconate cycloisomerase